MLLVCTEATSSRPETGGAIPPSYLLSCLFLYARCADDVARGLLRAGMQALLILLGGVRHFKCGKLHSAQISALIC